jgi:hypothetical protein
LDKSCSRHTKDTPVQGASRIRAQVSTRNADGKKEKAR